MTKYVIGGINFTSNGVPDSCPFGTSVKDTVSGGQSGLDLFGHVAAQYKDADGCPFAAPQGANPTTALGGNPVDNREFLYACEPFYRDFYKVFGPKTYQDRPDAKLKASIIGCCHLSRSNAQTVYHQGVGQVTLREDCVLNNKEIFTKMQNATGNFMFQLDMPQPVVNDASQLKTAEEKKKTFKETQLQCLNDTKSRIGKFFAAKRAVACIANAKRVIKDRITNDIADAVSHGLDQTVTAQSGSNVVGSSPGAIVTVPGSPAGVVAQVASAIGLGTRLTKIAVTAAEILDYLLNDCSGIIPGFGELDQWRKALNGEACLPIFNLIERQMTQCIRVDFQLDLSLPQFQMALQCPININISGRLSPQGFDCYANATSTNPLTASYGSSVISGNGGIEQLFNGACFKGNTSTATSTGGSPVDGPISGTRIPGVDCGPLSTDPGKQQAIQGQTALASNRTSNGWAIGGSESVGGIQITRCDYFELGRRVRTNYVFGSGSSCNSGASGFLDGGFETNTACYPGGGYIPLVQNIPDACMYPAGCLDTSGDFSQAFLGQSGCPANTQPTFNVNAQYPVGVSGGLNAGAAQYRSCSDYSSATDPAPVCCDPQLQDCRARNANVPLCACNEGDASNTVTANGSCTQGGEKTCCSPRLNGGAAGCAALGYGTSDICADEQNQCVGAGTVGTWTGPNGSTQSFTAGQIVSAKPSPYIYLFVRTDAKINGQACCTTEWCNVCPQHYANAYGLSLTRANLTSVPDSDADNNALIGKGWPYVETTDSQGFQAYRIGQAALPLVYQENPKNDLSNNMHDYFNFHPDLHLSSMLKLPLSLNACNTATGLPASVVGIAQFTGGGAMGWTHDAEPKKSRIDWRTYAPIPDMTEYPIDYLNRLLASRANPDGTPVEPVKLCSDVVQICTPGSATGGVTSGGTGGGSTGGGATGGGSTGGGSTGGGSGGGAGGGGTSGLVDAQGGIAAQGGTTGGSTQVLQSGSTTSSTTTTNGATAVPSATGSTGSTSGGGLF